MDADGKGTTYTRMTGFTSLSEGKTLLSTAVSMWTKRQKDQMS